MMFCGWKGNHAGLGKGNANLARLVYDCVTFYMWVNCMPIDRDQLWNIAWEYTFTLVSITAYSNRMALWKIADYCNKL